MSARGPDAPMVALPPANVISTVLVAGEHRAVGAIRPAEMEELERAAEAGDIRAEDKLRIIRTGVRRQAVVPAPSATPGARWDDPPSDPGEDIARFFRNALGRP